MSWQFRRSRKLLGPFRLSVSKTGVGVSTRVGPVRVSQHSTGQRNVTIRSGIRGVFWRKRSRR